MRKGGPKGGKGLKEGRDVSCMRYQCRMHLLCNPDILGEYQRLPVLLTVLLVIYVTDYKAVLLGRQRSLKFG